jgi:hypothetical protein
MEYPPPNGYFAKDFLVYGSLEKGGSVSRGFRLFPLDMKGASETTLGDIHAALVRYLQAIPLNQRVQWQWRKNSDYNLPLDKYRSETASFTNPEALRLRQHTEAYFRRMVASKQLHREHLEIYPTIKIDRAAPTFASRASLKEYYATVLTHLTSAFEQIHSELTAAFGNEVVIEPMVAEDHYLQMYAWFNPDNTAEPSILGEHFKPSRSFHFNCWRSDISTTKIGRLYYGGHYHGVLVLRMMGSHTGETMMHHLTKAGFVDYEITLNCKPLDTQTIIKREEDESRSLQLQEVDDSEKEGVSSPSRQSTVRLKAKRIDQLSEGHTRVFSVTLVVHAWAPSENTLAARLSALKQCVIQMKNAQVYDAHLPATALDLLYLTMPGNAFHAYDARAIEIEDIHLANFIPFSASFTGDLASPQALYQSSDNALVALRFQKNGQPQHTGVLGATGTGKSTMFRNAMFQTADFFQFDVIVESGLWHADYTRSFGCEPIILRRDGNVSLNYLDTGALPLGTEHLGLAVTQTMHMAGYTSDTRLMARRESYLTFYLRQVYKEAYENWLRTNSHRIDQIHREATAVQRWHAEKMRDDDTLLMAYADLRDRVAANNPEALEFIHKISERDVTTFVTARDTHHLAMNHVFAYFLPEEYPRHADLQDLIAMRPFGEHNREDVAELAELLRKWTAAEGAFGPLFDGVTNRSLNARVVHFENGAGDQTDSTLKQAASLTIAGKVRQRIIQLPRSMPKRFVWEEFAADVNVPNNDKLAHELAAQMRKFNCVFAYLVQNYGQFEQTAVCSPLLSNTSQYLIFRQEDTQDVKRLAPRIAMPDSIADAVTKFPKVINMPVGARHSTFAYFSRVAHPTIAGSAIFAPAQVHETVEPVINRPSSAA